MGADVKRKNRLEELLSVAQAYRGWNRRRLARALGRDASNLIPVSGFPKIDLVVELARVLDWNVEAVIKSFWIDEPRDDNDRLADDGRPFVELEEDAKVSCREGRYRDAVDLARRTLLAASSSEERAIACIREASGWDGLGRYLDALEASKRGLAESGVSTDRRLALQSNLANGYYTLWHPIEARAMSHELVELFDSRPVCNRMNEVSRAFAYYVRGNAYRRLIGTDDKRRIDHARGAMADLKESNRHYLQLAEKYAEQAYSGVAHTCRGGIIEASVVLGERDADDALAEIGEMLEEIVDPATCRCGDWLESYGWWCIYGCNVALRHLDDERSLQQHLAVFTNKADEIAERTNNWAMRERIVTMEYARRRRFAEWTGVDADWTMDVEDVRAIAGTMGRFPLFHETGWKVLRTARIVKDTERNGHARKLGAGE